MTKKSEPIRTCVGCGVKAPQSTQVRFVSDGAGGVVAGRTAPGRGAWLCQATAADCLARAIKRRAFARALRTRVDHHPDLGPAAVPAGRAGESPPG